MKESYAPVREVKRVEIEIAGEGYKGKITGLRGELDFFSRQPLFQVWVDFEEPYPDPGIESMSVYIPAKYYTRDELISVVGLAVVEKLVADRKRRRDFESYWVEQQRLEVLAQKVAEDIRGG
jgi:hypothetical protein